LREAAVVETKRPSALFLSSRHLIGNF